MNFEIPELKIILDEISELKKNVQENKSNEISSYWFNDEQCWKLKGGMALNTYRNNRFYQCKGGVPDAYVGGRKVWSKESVIEWIPLSDAELENYHNKYKTGAKKK